MKKILYIPLVVCAVLLLLQACYKDEGNYTYTEINQVTIDGLQSDIEAYLTTDGIITIMPEVTGSLYGTDDSNYSYAWVVSRGDGSRDTIATTRNLENFEVPVGPGSEISMRFRVQDNSTGKLYDRLVTIKYVGAMDYGRLVMLDVDGEMQLDFLMMDVTTRNHSHVSDILSKVGCTLPKPYGKPIKVTSFSNGLKPAMGNRATYVLTDRTTARLHASSLTYNESLSPLSSNFLSPSMCPEGFIAEDIVVASYSTSRSALLLNQGNCYNFNQTTFLEWGSPVNYIRRKNGEIKYFNVTAAAGHAYDYMVFDNDTKSFYRVPTVMRTKIDTIPHTKETLYWPPADDTGVKAKYNNTGMDLVYLGASWMLAGLVNNAYYIKNPSIYSIQKDPSGDLYLLHTKHTQNGAYGEGYYGQENFVKINKAATPDIDNAELFTVGGEYETNVYYSVGGKLYAYSIANNTSVCVLDLGAERGDKITYIGFMDNNFHGIPGYFAIHIGSYNEATKKGSYEVYAIPGAQSALVPWTNGMVPAAENKECRFINSFNGKIVSVCVK